MGSSSRSSHSNSSSNRCNSGSNSRMVRPGVVAHSSSGNRGDTGLATMTVVEESLDGKAEGAVVQSLSTSPRPEATYTHRLTRHPFHGPKAARQQFTPTILARDATAAIKLVIVIGNVRAHVFNRTNCRGVGRVSVAITSEFQSHENESATLLERIEQLGQLQPPTYDPATNSDPYEYWMSPDLQQG